MGERAAEKQEKLIAALERGMAMVHLDARCDGVRVPDHLGQEAHLRLNLSYKFDPPDLAVGVLGVRSTLSFSGRRFLVQIPWASIFAITSHTTQEFWLYPEDMPAEVLERAAESATVVQRQPLQEVPPVAAAAPSPPEESGDGQPTKRHLRLVK